MGSMTAARGHHRWCGRRHRVPIIFVILRRPVLVRAIMTMPLPSTTLHCRAKRKFSHRRKVDDVKKENFLCVFHGTENTQDPGTTAVQQYPRRRQASCDGVATGRLLRRGEYRHCMT